METNLRQIVNPTEDTESDSSAWKLIVLIFLGLCSSALAGYYLNGFFLAGNFSLLITSFCFTAVMAILMIFNALFVKSKWLLRGIVFVECFTVSAFFMPIITPQLITQFAVALALFVIFAIQGVGRGVKILNNSLSVHFFETAKPIASKLATGFLIFLSIMAYVEFIDLGRLSSDTGRLIMNQVFVSAEPVFKLQFSGVSFNQNVGEFVKAIAWSTINKTRFEPINDPNLGLRGDLTQLPRETQNRIAEALSISLLQSLESKIGSLGVNESVQDAMFRIIKDWLGRFTGTAKKLLGITGVVLAFFALRGIALILMPAIEFIGYVIYKLLLASGFARVANEVRNREFVVL